MLCLAARDGIGLALDGVLLLLVAAAAVTDVRAGKVYNKLTYPALLAGLLLHALLPAPAGIGIGRSLLGVLAAGGPLLLAYLAGGIGGGDVKIAAVAGAFLGPWAGLTAALYACLVGGVLSLALIVWREGLEGLITRLRPPRSAPDAIGAASPPGPAPRETLRFPFAVAILVAIAWIVTERILGTSLLIALEG